MPTPPQIDRATLQSLADLARLHVAPERHAVLAERLQRIVQAFDSLRELPLPPAATTIEPRACPLRADEPGTVLTVDEVLANASRAAAGAFVVPRVVDA